MSFSGFFSASFFMTGRLLPGLGRVRIRSKKLCIGNTVARRARRQPAPDQTSQVVHGDGTRPAGLAPQHLRHARPGAPDARSAGAPHLLTRGETLARGLLPAHEPRGKPMTTPSRTS